MRTGILGGSFNPVHQQHLQMARAAMVEHQLEEVWFVPVFRPVHKPDASLLDFADRLALLQLAVAGEEKFFVSEIEKELGGPSFTINTVEALQQRFPQRSFFLLIGGDSLGDLPSWREIGRLVTMCEFIVIERPGFAKMSPVITARINWAECEPSAVSASQIRESLRSGDRVISGLAPEVLHAILRHNYYKSLSPEFEPALKAVEEQLKLLPGGLITHIEGVARLAVKYAAQLAVDPRAALIAGLAHDLFRVSPDDRILSLAAAADIALSEAELGMPMLAHGAAAAGFLAEKAAGLSEMVLAAIRGHTFPEADSPLLTQILAVADTLESSRGIARRDEIRESGCDFARMYQEVLQIKASRGCSR